jgi:beta-lactamase class A
VVHRAPARHDDCRLSRRATLRAGGAGLAAFLAGAGLAPTQAQEATPTASADPIEDGLSAEIIEAVSPLPGTVALKLWAPPDAGRPAWSVRHNADQLVFIASAFKGFVLAEVLRQAEASLDPRADTPLNAQLGAYLARELPLDAEIFSFGSTVLNPPNLTGLVRLRTALDAMIAHSDNTATDMALRFADPERVRALIAELDLTQTRIPDSTRQFIAYYAGDPEWATVTWDELQTLLTDEPYPTRPVINDEITMASTPDELVSFYSRALPGELFRYPETLTVFRSILALPDLIGQMMPLGLNAFLKGGSLDATPDHALSMAGGLYVPDRWVYFAFIVNWTDDEAGLVAEVGPAFLTAGHQVFTLVRDRLGS